MQGDRRTDMPRNPMQALPDGKLIGPGRLDNQVFLTMHHECGIGNLEQAYAGMWILRSNGFMTKIDAEVIPSEFANHSREEHGCGFEGQIGKLVPVAKIPKHRCARAQLPVGVPGVNRERGRTARHECGNSKTLP